MFKEKCFQQEDISARISLSHMRTTVVTQTKDTDLVPAHSFLPNPGPNTVPSLYAVFCIQVSIFFLIYRCQDTLFWKIVWVPRGRPGRVGNRNWIPQLFSAVGLFGLDLHNMGWGETRSCWRCRHGRWWSGHWGVSGLRQVSIYLLMG